jgi:hypothetical protein
MPCVGPPPLAIESTTPEFLPTASDSAIGESINDFRHYWTMIATVHDGR